LKTPITRKGYEQLREELDRLKRAERPKVIQAIAEARSHGDLSENAEYHAAKERQSFIEGRIQELETKLANARIIETHQLTAEKVAFGSTVLLLDLESNAKKKYTLVGQDESDLKNGKISVTSPVGRALISHKVGDRVEINTPARIINYEILEISLET
jgi:transcription elongation factor GreA